MREEDLFEPVRSWLEGQEYSVSSEVRDCDIVARHRNRPEDIIIVELKTRMSLNLVNQGVRRKELTESVYLAVPLHGSKGRLKNAAATLQTLRRLELGLLYVRFLRGGTRVEPVLHPREHTPRRRPGRRTAIIREIDHRYAELDRAGQPAGTVRFSAYRQRALLTAAILSEEGESSPRGIRDRGGPDECGRIMSANHYGWFDRVRRGQYRLSEAGIQAVTTFADTITAIRGKKEDGENTIDSE
jgi:hypothetical protein